MSKRILIGVSSCLLGNRVRYDGGHKYQPLISNEMDLRFELIALCPEVEVGMGVPRLPIRLIGDLSHASARGIENPEIDMTIPLRDYGIHVASTIPHICGYIFKARSPSCGFLTTPIYSDTGEVVAVANGLYANALLRERPDLPAIDEESFADARLRHAFLDRAIRLHQAKCC